MKYATELLTYYATFFVVSGVLLFGIPLSWCFMTWDWGWVTIQNLFLVLRINLVVSLGMTIWFLIDLSSKSKMP